MPGDASLTCMALGVCPSSPPERISFGRLPEALAQDLLGLFDLESLAQLSHTNQLWRKAALADGRVRYHSAYPAPHQPDWLRWQQDANASLWHERVCSAIAANRPHLLALLLGIGQRADPELFGVLTGANPNVPADPSYLMRAAQVPSTRCAKVLLASLPFCAAQVCRGGFRASHYALASGSNTLFRTLRLAELAEGASLHPIPYPPQPQPTRLISQALPDALVQSGHYDVLLRWVEIRHMTSHHGEADAPSLLADLDRAIATIPGHDSLQAKWTLRKLVATYAQTLPADEAWRKAVKAMFLRQPRLHVSPERTCYLPLDDNTAAAVEEVWRHHPLPSVPRPRRHCASSTASLTTF